MAPLDKETLDYWKSKPESPWFRESTLSPGESKIFTALDVNKNTNIANPSKFSVKGPQGEILGWNYRFHLDNGQTWDVARGDFSDPILKAGLADGKPVKFKITHLNPKPLQGSKYLLEVVRE